MIGKALGLYEEIAFCHFLITKIKIKTGTVFLNIFSKMFWPRSEPSVMKYMQF